MLNSPPECRPDLRLKGKKSSEVDFWNKKISDTLCITPQPPHK